MTASGARRWLRICLAVGLAAVGLGGCGGGGVERLAADYCDYLRNGHTLDFSAQQAAIVALDERLHAQEIRRGRMRAALQQRCPEAIAEPGGQLLGVMGAELLEMGEEMRALRR